MMTAKTVYMLNRYTENAYTDKYIIGVNRKGVIYATFHNSVVLPLIVMSGKTEKGLETIRYRPNNKTRDMLLRTATKVLPICTEKELEALNKAVKYNRGEIFEKLVFEKFGQVWHKDSTPYTEAGDIEIDSTPYQIKYEQATICKESDF